MPHCVDSETSHASRNRVSDSALEYEQLLVEISRVRIAGVALVGHGVLVAELVPPDDR